MRLSFSLGRFFNKATNNNNIITSTNDLYISSSPIHGRGVFANRHFAKGGIIELCPILEIPLSYLHQNSELVLNYYAFMLDEEKDRSMILLGYGSIYNHACPSSAATEFLPDKKVMVLTAIKPIARHEEITINYHGPTTPPNQLISGKQMPENNQPKTPHQEILVPTNTILLLQNQSTNQLIIKSVNQLINLPHHILRVYPLIKLFCSHIAQVYRCLLECFALFERCLCYFSGLIVAYLRIERSYQHE